MDSLWQRARDKLSHSALSHLQINSPFTIPSGIITTTPATIARIAQDVPEIGFLTTKTLSVAPRAGYREPIIHEYYPGCFVNAVGLANPGAANFLESMRSRMPLHGNKPLFVSIMGEHPDEFLECARILEPIADAFELNLSCPHVKGAGQCVGTDPGMVRAVLRLLKQHVKKPIIPKLSPNLPDMRAMASLCEEAGADALCLINTLGPGVAADADGYPVLTNVTGGMSGSGILPAGLKAVREAASAVDLPLIAAGGIASAQDVRAYHEAGASLFSVGSALTGMSTPEVVQYLKQIAVDLEDASAAALARVARSCNCRTAYYKTRVGENLDVGAGIFKLRLEEGPSCEPGRFFFLRLPGVGEKPFSPVADHPPEYLVRNIGPFTAALEGLKPGDPIYMRGPYGKGFPEPRTGRRLVLLGGGTGSAPIMMAANRWPERVARAFFGFSGEISEGFRNEILATIPRARVTVDPPGRVGEVTRALIEDMAADPHLYEECQVFLCGPAAMMRVAVDILTTTVPRKDIFLGREDIMRCGIGVCGSCGTETGLRSCVDGPVMNP